MKLKYIAFVLFFYSATSWCQFTFTDLNGNSIANNSVLTFNTFNTESAKLKFKVNNIGTTNLDIRIKVVSITNGTGTGFQLCFGGLCHDNIAINSVYPDYVNTIAPGASNGNFDYFVNNIGSTNGNPVDYVFNVYSLVNGFPTGQSFTITYRYNPSAMSIENFNSMNPFTISSIFKSNLEIDALTKGHIIIYDCNGKLISERDIESGINSINTDTWSNGIYIGKIVYGNQHIYSFKCLKQ